MGLWEKFKEFRGYAQRPPGTTSYDGFGELDGHRFHLRVDSDKKGVLMVDASKLIFLNGTALDYVSCFLEGLREEEAVRLMRKRYRDLDVDTAKYHYLKTQRQLVGYVVQGDESVIQNIGQESMNMGADELPAPYRMDLVLTYKCQNGCLHCYNEKRPKEEYGLTQWYQVQERLWEAGVPHIVFTGGEATLYPHLRELIVHSEAIGQVTGLITNGRKLKDRAYLRDLIEAGLDHVQITLLSHRESVHDRLAGAKGAWKETVEGIKAAVAEDIHLVTNTTIMASNVDEMEDTMRFLISLGVENIAFNSIIRSGKGKNTEGIDYQRLEEVLDKLNGIAQEEFVKLTWYSPTPYCDFNPINHGLGIKQCTACSLNMAVEPDGTVLPCQSYYEGLGNILTDSWDSIWNHELCEEIRGRKYLPEKCSDCELKQLCGGGCPLSLKEGEDGVVCQDWASG